MRRFFHHVYNFFFIKNESKQALLKYIYIRSDKAVIIIIDCSKVNIQIKQHIKK